MTGTKCACREGECGACTVLMDGEPTWACQISAGDAQGSAITTIEGLATDDRLNAVQQAWIEHDVAQCGYCQAGHILTATQLLRRNPKPTDADIDDAMDRHLCRCGTYIRIRAAIHAAAAKVAAGERL